MRRVLERSYATHAALVISISILGGCSAFSGYPTDFQNTDAVIAADEPYLSAEVRTIEDNPSDAARNGLTQQQYRDAVVYRRLEVIDINYYDFESKLTTAYNLLDVGADLTALILNGLGATTGVATTKAALAAASAGVIGAKGAINTDIFYQKTLPALITQMRANRQTVLVTIKTGLQSAVAKYSLDAALMDVSNYYVAGTLPSAVAQVTAQAGTSLQKANADLAVVQGAAFLPSYPARVSLETQVSNLTNAQALAVFKSMQQYISTRSAFVQNTLNAADPNGLAATNGASAKALLRMWVSIDPLDAALEAHWTAAINAATASK
jgi:hypothetical protein